MVRHYAAAGGIQISASHNPIEYNGLKLISAEGRVVPAVTDSEVLNRYRREETQPRDKTIAVNLSSAVFAIGEFDNKTRI